MADAKVDLVVMRDGEARCNASGRGCLLFSVRRDKLRER